MLSILLPGSSALGQAQGGIVGSQYIRSASEEPLAEAVCVSETSHRIIRVCWEDDNKTTRTKSRDRGVATTRCEMRDSRASYLSLESPYPGIQLTECGAGHGDSRRASSSREPAQDRGGESRLGRDGFILPEVATSRARAGTKQMGHFWSSDSAFGFGFGHTQCNVAVGSRPTARGPCGCRALPASPHLIPLIIQYAMPPFSLPTSCCAGRAPPSPDCVPSRPVIPGTNAKGTKDHIPSWHSVDTTELRAIFEDTMPSDPCRANHITHKSSAKFREILEGGKEVETDTESELIQTKRSSATLKAVTQKLKKHLSKEDGVSKRLSRASIGTSEEEVERRAELRRIRERRIREELSNEGIYDEDAKSLPSTPGTPPKDDRPSAWVPGDFVPLPHLSPLRLPAPGLDPLEMAHELLCAADPTPTATPQRQSCSSSPGATAVNTTTSISRRYSSPVLSDRSVEGKEPLVYLPVRKRSSLPQVPAAPIIRAQRLPSLADPTISAWRLSFSADKRGEHLRKLSQEHSYPITLKPEPLRSLSPPADRWLHSQGLRSPSQAIVEPAGEDTVAVSASRTDQAPTDQDFGGVDGIKETSTAVHLHDMHISKQLSSKGLPSSASSPQSSSRESYQLGASSTSNIPQVATTERARDLRSTSDSAHLSERIPDTWGAVIEHRSSSIYPSAGNSVHHSRESSFFSLLSFLPGAKGRDLQACKEAVASQSLPELTLSPVVNPATSSLSIPPARHHHHSTPDDSSLLASETASFHEREAELSVVETRFATSEIVKIRNSPVSSRFKEEFHAESEEVPEVQPRKLSVLTRLTKFTVKSYDGTSKMEELLDIPMPSFNAESLRSPGGLFSPGSGPSTMIRPLAELDDSAHLWGKAIKKDGRAEDVANNLRLPGRQGTVAPKKSALEGELPKSAFGTIFGGLGKGKKKKIDISDHKGAAEEYNQRFQERMAVKELVMDSWEDEMAATAAKAKTKSKNIVKRSKPTMPDKRYPATWSRFSSESRVERCISAGAVDRVDVKDFAVLGHKEDGEIIWCLEHDDDGHHAEIDILHRGFRAKVGDRVKHKVYKLDTSDEQSQQTSGRRGSLTIAGELEYPELEVLPFTLRTTEEMAAEIHAEEEEARKKEEEEKAKRPHIPKLAVRNRMDGSADLEGDVQMEVEGKDATVISIADPRFYDDCVLHPGLEGKSADIEKDFTFDACTVRGIGGEKREKFRTWGGKDWEGYLQRTASVNVRGSAGVGQNASRRSRNASMGTMVMRKSTDDYFGEVERMERRERERVLTVAEVAWGSGN
ncbi:hypothetical protein JHW43_008162 [Diplocarpon mali]|nr:hypothetical protein JHW43_008162 [Diplocarpon mali]